MAVADATPATEPNLSARWIEALDRQAMIIMAIFARAGFEPIAPPVLQPADVFLDLIGEELRARSYVFADPLGAELCLRPDLTIPACRLYLERHGHDGAPARYSYNGPVFRYQPGGGSLIRPREFRQAGIECFAAADPAKAEAEILALSAECVRAAGLRAFRLHFGDLGILNALLAAIDMPARWRERLQHHFWRPEAFRQQLKILVQPATEAANLPTSLLQQLDRASRADAARAVVDHLDSLGLAVQGTRSIDEIADHLRGRAADQDAPRLPQAAADLLETYLALDVPATAAGREIGKLAGRYGIDLSKAIDAYENRLQLAADENIDISQATFAASFGRTFEYYTGFVFEIRSPNLDDDAPLCGGGRYDTLLKAINGNRSIPAVGAAIHCERLLLAVRGGRA